MAPTDPVSQADLESAFRDDPDSAFELLDAGYRENILRYIKLKTFGLLDEDELMVAYQESMLALVELARRPGFDARRPLRIVYEIARNKGMDILRDHGHRVNTNEDAIVDWVAADLKNTDLGYKWCANIGPTEAKEFRVVLLEIIQTLPTRQRIVALCFVDHFEDFRTRDIYEPLVAAVSVVTGEVESVAAVKSVWRFAREKIAAALARRGYSFIRGE